MQQLVAVRLILLIANMLFNISDAFVGKVMRLVVSVRPSVSTLRFEPTDILTLIFARVLVMTHDHSSPKTESQGHVSRAIKTCVSGTAASSEY